MTGFGCLPCVGTSSSLGAPGHLEEPWCRLLPNGEILAALVLSTTFSEKYKGRGMQPGDRAEIRLPALPGGEPRVWRPTLLHRAGNKEVCVFIWLNEEATDFPAIFLAFAPLMNVRQFLKVVLSAKHSLVESEPIRQEPAFRMLAYVQRKLANLWQKYDFQAKLEDTLRRYPEHLLLSCGISHGATVAQATTLKLSLMYPDRRFQAVTWNHYKFLDESGIALLKSEVGKRLLPFVISRRHYWDSIAGAPRDLSPVPHCVFLDTDTGQCRAAKDLQRTRLGPWNLWRAWRLHFARRALRATRLAMETALREMAGEPTGGWADTLRRQSMNLRAWSFGPGDPLLAQERELGRYERRELFQSDREDRE